VIWSVFSFETKQNTKGFIFVISLSENLVDEDIYTRIQRDRGIVFRDQIVGKWAIALSIVSRSLLTWVTLHH